MLEYKTITFPGHVYGDGEGDYGENVGHGYGDGEGGYGENVGRGYGDGEGGDYGCGAGDGAGVDVDSDYCKDGKIRNSIHFWEVIK